MLRYIELMQNKSFDKIESFVRDQITSKPSIVITQTCKGYRVNNFKIQKKDDHWAVIGPAGNLMENLFSKRLSILAAVFTIKKKYPVLAVIKSLDYQLMHLKHDRKLFDSKIHQSSNTSVFEDRLSRVIDDLEKVYLQISELEKSVGLQ